MLREQIAPGLRALAMKGSRGSFSLPDPTHHLLVGFQASYYSTSETVRFTVDLAAIDRAAWTARHQGWWGRPSANSQAPIGVHERLRAPMPDREGDWWDVASGDDTAGLSEHLCVAVREHGLRWLRAARSQPESSTPWLGLDRARRGEAPDSSG